jgi:hypothetical protein
LHDNQHSLGGRVLNGLRWVRNQGTHQIVNPQSWSGPGLMFPAAAPFEFSAYQVCWLSREAMPDEGKVTRALVAQRAAYDDFLAGRPVRDSLQSAMRWLVDRAASFGTPQPGPSRWTARTA